MIKQINDTVIDGMGTLIGLWPRLQGATELRAVVQRGGRPVVLSVTVALKRPMRFVLALLAVLALSPRVEAWGFAAHRVVNRSAVSTLPEPLATLFAANADYLAEHSIDPDLWRTAGMPAEDPNHFLDMDALGADPVPRAEGELIARLGASAAGRGRLPWRVAEVYEDLVEAFRARDTPRRPRAGGGPRPLRR